MKKVSIKGKLVIANLHGQRYCEFCIEDKTGNYYFIGDDDEIIAGNKKYNVEKSWKKHSAAAIDNRLPPKPMMKDGTIMEWTPANIDTDEWFSLFLNRTPCIFIQGEKHRFFYNRRLETITTIA